MVSSFQFFRFGALGTLVLQRDNFLEDTFSTAILFLGRGSMQ
jgi:hypothetical protein